MSEQLFLLAKSVLEARGVNEYWNLIRVARVYRDERITIEGVLDEDGESLDAMYISLHMSPDQAETPPPMEVKFALSRSTPKEETPVYQWREATQYFRPGRWILYLEQLYQQIYEQYERSRQLNGTPVNDERLFPHIQLPEQPPAETNDAEAPPQA